MINIASIDYSNLKREYLRGDISQRELAEKYDIPYGTLRKVAAKEQWTQLRNKVRAKADAKIIDAISDKEAQKAVDIINVADKLLSKIEELADTLAVDTQSLKQLTSALRDLKDIKGYKSEADQLEQAARIAKLQKEAEREDDTTNEVEVIFNAGPGEWNE